MKFKKETAEVYTFTELPHHVWAKFTVQDLGNAGRVSIASDYGDWQNGWNACGGSFKQFLCDLGMDYVAGKVGADRWFDADRTIKEYRDDLVRYRKEQIITKELAAKIKKQIEYLESESSETGFCVILERDCPDLMKFYEWCPELRHGVHPMFRNMWNECWPLFTAELKREMECTAAPVIT